MKKGYRGLVVWLVVYAALLLGLCFLPNVEIALRARLMMNWTSIAVAALTYIVYRTERVYWYSGIDYEAAVQAGSERRKAYARRCYGRFLAFAGAFLAYTLIAHALNWHFAADMIVAGLGLMLVALDTLRIRL